MEKLDSYQKYLFRVEERELSRLIENIETSVNMALLQSQRILEDNASFELPRVNPGPDQVLFLMLFADIHFYLVSVDNIRKSIDRLDKALKGRLADLKNSYREFFDSANRVRRHQEHLDERIQAGKYHGKALYDNWMYEVCGDSVIIGPPAARNLIDLYRIIDERLESIFPPRAGID
jgi:hypothetical protein